MTGFGFLVLWICAVYHLVMGGFCLMSASMMKRAVGVLYAVKFPDPIDPGLEFLWKPLGAFAIVLSFFCFRGILVEDAEYRVFLLRTLAGLFVLRAWIRWFYRDLFQRAHGTPLKRNLINIGINVTAAVLTLIYGVR